MQTNIFIIIVTYNGIKWLDACLLSTAEYEVVIVDNASSDSTVDFIQKEYPRIKLFQQKENLGFGQANNIGISYALEEGADAVFLLNQDAYLKEGAIENLIDFSDKNPEYGILSPIHLDGSGNYLDRNFSYYLSYDQNRSFFSDAVLRDLKKFYEVPFVNAAGWYIPKKTFEIVGGFDPIFFHYGEDDNFCQRVLYHNFKIAVIPGAKLLHDRSKNNLSVIDPLVYWERQLKLKWANINNRSFEVEFPEICRQEKKKYYKYLIKLQTVKARKVARKLSILKRIEIEITQSKKLNCTGKILYL